MDLNKALRLLGSRYDHEIPEMWCSCIHDPFKKILKKNLEILFENGYITMYGKYIDSSDRVYEEEAKINYLRLELFSQSTSHLEKDKLASISYNYDTHSISYEAYLLAKATIAENTIPNAPNFEPAYIFVTSG
ncbi:hypothetical protein C1646_762173 [Rhizophagus diaphanus]|nr:hypothetical protein C1646_762173 [Rhizophagus diaphanus] [Rhizophagus sp. MUCL 43196]